MEEKRRGRIGEKQSIECMRKRRRNRCEKKQGGREDKGVKEEKKVRDGGRRKEGAGEGEKGKRQRQKENR